MYYKVLDWFSTFQPVVGLSSFHLWLETCMWRLIHHSNHLLALILLSNSCYCCSLEQRGLFSTLFLFNIHDAFEGKLSVRSWKSSITLSYVVRKQQTNNNSKCRHCENNNEFSCLGLWKVSERQLTKTCQMSTFGVLGTVCDFEVNHLEMQV